MAADTQVLRADGTRDEWSKIYASVSGSFVVGCCGTAAYLPALSWVLSRTFGNFDDVLQTMPAKLAEAWSVAAELGRAEGVQITPLQERYKVLCVGWSPKEDRCLGRAYIQRSARDGFEEQSFPDNSFACHPSPSHLEPGWLAKFDAAGIPSTVEGMHRLAELQVDFIRAVMPGRQPGGRLVVAQITREGMAIRAAGELDTF